MVMKNFEFKSQICTTKEQSERLLALGLKKETADMVHYKSASMKVWGVLATPFTKECEGCKSYYPAWSLHRLLEMLYQDIGECMIFFPNTYDEIIADIENCIRRGTFNKDYLEEKK
jgi:hypothetical protein